MAVCSMRAEDFRWLTFSLADGSDVAVAAENLDMTYSEGVLSLTSPSVNTTFQIENIKSMRFTSDASGITTLQSDLAGKAEYFTVAGVSAGVFESIDDARCALPSGVYVAVSGDKCVKVIF